MGIFSKAFMMQAPAVPDVMPHRSAVPIMVGNTVDGKKRLEKTKKERYIEYTLGGVGAGLTLLALAGMLRSTAKNETRKVQTYMRYRVLAQFLTIASVTGCLLYFASQRKQEGAAGIQEGHATSDTQIQKH